MVEETITVGEVSRGDDAGTDVELPVVDVLTGRSFITGKSGSGKSNTASVVCEKLLDQGYGLLIVDIDGEYYGLKEEYEILHVGDDEECDLRVGVEHAEKIADLALEQNVSIILDVSSFLEESEARELLTEVTRQLFAKEKKLKQPFLMLVEEVHEYIPEGGGVDECGRMLIKVGKRGRKHGLGIVGISQRPADVKKDFITQCDWLVFHRLTWNNDTKVVGRLLGSDYADYVESLDDGECFLMTDWAEEIRPVQFERKRTFDAGETPGLEDFERPELKSVSGELLEELQTITENQQKRADRIDELERQLQKRDERIRDLERQLSEARNLERMADRFSRAMMEHAAGRPTTTPHSDLEEALVDPSRRDEELYTELKAVRDGDEPGTDGRGEPDDADLGTHDAESETDAADRNKAIEDPLDAIAAELDDTADTNDGIADTNDGDTDANDDTGWGPTSDPDGVESADSAATDSETGSETGATVVETGDPLVDRLRTEIADLGSTPLSMLRHYREYGPTTPRKAHAAIGESGDRTAAYAANRSLRKRGLVAHVGRGNHDYALSRLVVEESKDPFAPERSIPPDERDAIVAAIEATFIEDVETPARFDGRAAASVADGRESPEDHTAWPDP